jgi:hypothetical protein
MESEDQVETWLCVIVTLPFTCRKVRGWDLQASFLPSAFRMGVEGQCVSAHLRMYLEAIKHLPPAGGWQGLKIL